MRRRERFNGGERELITRKISSDIMMKGKDQEGEVKGEGKKY